MIKNILPMMILIMIVFSGCSENSNSNEKVLAERYIKDRKENYIKIKPYFNKIGKALFEKFPIANSILIGESIIIKNDISLLFKPTKEKIKNLQYFHDHNLSSKLGNTIYVANINIDDNTIQIKKISRYTEIQMIGIHEQEWNSDNFYKKLISFIFPQSESLIDLPNEINAMFKKMDVFGTLNMPKEILRKHIQLTEIK